MNGYDYLFASIVSFVLALFALHSKDDIFRSISMLVPYFLSTITVYYFSFALSKLYSGVFDPLYFIKMSSLLVNGSDIFLIAIVSVFFELFIFLLLLLLIGIILNFLEVHIDFVIGFRSFIVLRTLFNFAYVFNLIFFESIEFGKVLFTFIPQMIFLAIIVGSNSQTLFSNSKKRSSLSKNKPGLSNPKQ